jgi:hypothetical protein
MERVQSSFFAHYVPRGTMKLEKKESADLKQGSMTLNEFLNSFIQLSRYAPNDINTDKKKQDMFLNGLNDDIQFQLLNSDYADFQHMIDKAIVIENKIKEMEKMARGRCHSMDNPLEAMLGLTSRSLTSSSGHHT